MAKEHYSDSTRFRMTPAGMQMYSLQKLAEDGLKAKKITKEEAELLKISKPQDLFVLDDLLHILVKLGAIEIIK